MARYSNSGPRAGGPGGVRVIAPQDGEAIILGAPWECDTHPVPVDMANPKRGIQTKGCTRADGRCPHCQAGIKVDWRAYFPAYGISIKSSLTAKGGVARGQCFVLPTPSNCFLTLREFAKAEAGIRQWRGIKARFRRAAYRELVAEIVGRVTDDGSLPASFDPRAVVLRAWGDPAALTLDGDRGTGPTILTMSGTDDVGEPETTGAHAPPSPATISPQSRVPNSLPMKEALVRFEQLPASEKERWLAAAKGSRARLPETLLRERAAALWVNSIVEAG